MTLAGLRRALALRAVLAAARDRTVGPLPSDPRFRRVLLVLPATEAGQHAAWDLLRDLDVMPGAVLPVSVGEGAPYAPDAYAGRVLVVGRDARDWRGLPDGGARRAIREAAPDVALNLAEPGDLAAALLAGASPAAVRIARFHPDAEPVHDLLVEGPPDAVAAVAALRRLLAQVSPPLLAFR